MLTWEYPISIGHFSNRSFTASVPRKISAVVWNGKGVKAKRQGISDWASFVNLGRLQRQRLVQKTTQDQRSLSTNASILHNSQSWFLEIQVISIKAKPTMNLDSNSVALTSSTRSFVSWKPWLHCPVARAQVCKNKCHRPEI